MSENKKKAAARETMPFKDKALLFILNNKSIVLLIAIMIIGQIVSGGIFFRGTNIAVVVRQASINAVLAMGFVMVLSSGMIDLSAGSMISLCSVIFAQAVVVWEIPMIFAILITMAVGLICGLANGLMVNKLNLIPFILTMGMGQVFRGLGYVISNGISLRVDHPVSRFIGQGNVFGVIPMTMVVFLSLAVISGLLVYRTSFGRHLLATGGNQEAAKVSGVNTAKTRILAFLFMGFVVSIAAIVLTGRVSIAMPDGGLGMEMDAIAAVIIGGTSLAGGKANVFGAICGALMLASISNLLNLAGVSSFWQWVCMGAIIVFAILLDSLTEKFFQKRQIAGV